MSELWTRATPKQGLLVGLLASLLWVGCRKSADTVSKPEPWSTLHSTRGSEEPAANAPVALTSGLSEPQLQAFYHLSEGSEFVPYCALKVYAKEHGRSLAQFFDAYHLIPDAAGPNNPLGLPIGLTLNQKEFNLVGFTCAACHVGRITADAPQVVVGGPGAFNIRQFYDDVLPWLASALKKPVLVRKIAGCLLLDLVRRPEGAASDEASVREELHAAVQLAPDATAPSKLYEHLDDASSEPEDSAAANAELEKASASAEGGSQKFKALSPDKRSHVLRDLRGRFERAKSLLVAFQQSLPNTLAVGAIEDTTLPGPGRVDAFMTALNLMNPGAKLHMDSPVAFPPLWNVNRYEWLHYDGDTNATLQRNMGQAVGIGALLGHEKGEPTKVIATTLNIASLLQLESLVALIQPPKWPFAQGDPVQIAAGRKIYTAECARCHEPGPDGKLREFKDDLKTDPMRLRNFEQTDKQIAANWPGKTLIQVLALQLSAVDAASNATPTQRDNDPKWRTTGRYRARMLRGVWSTAPYLHNNSVPTLADLLKRPADRPKKFVLDYAHYDANDIGYKLGKPTAILSEQFDTSQAGNDDGGHEFGTALSADEKLMLLSYLKQL